MKEKERFIDEEMPTEEMRKRVDRILEDIKKEEKKKKEQKGTKK